MFGGQLKHGDYPIAETTVLRFGEGEIPYTIAEYSEGLTTVYLSHF